MRRLIALNGDDWRLGRAPAGVGSSQATWSEMEQIEDWLPATVPGDVHADLQRAGQLPDPRVGCQYQAARWVNDHGWWLRRDWDQTAAPGERVHLVLRGLDYQGCLWLNGQPLGRFEGMFATRRYDVTALLADTNRLAVRLDGARWLPRHRSTLLDRLLNRVEAHLGSLSSYYPDRRDTLKCQMSFGWDFAPPLPTLGVWDDVWVVVSGEVLIENIAVQTTLRQGQARVELRVRLDAAEAGPARLACTLIPATFDGEPASVEQDVELPAGSGWQQVSVDVPTPHLWWPWDQGRPDCYQCVVQVTRHGRVVDRYDQEIGLRTVELDGWTLRVNGRPVYARGVNWVPASIFPGTLDKADYEVLLALARGAHANLVRVWGGGLREKAAFYSLCDRLGLLVWQEFPLSCAFLTRLPRSPEYLALLDAEARAIARDLQAHPSLVVWCGGNEFTPARNGPAVEVLRRAVADEDPTRPFLPSSPAQGDSHDWSVWHGFHPPAAYQRAQPGLASEFGLQAPPDLASLRGFVPASELWPPGAAWTCHGAQLDKLWRYAQPFLPPGDTHLSPQQRRLPRRRFWDRVDLETFVSASQRAQAEGLRVGIEHYRRLKAVGNGGAIVWQLNEPWPAISWALVGHDRETKPAYHAVRRAFQPILVSLDYAPRIYRAGDALDLDVWVINDGPEALLQGHLEVLLFDGQGGQADRLQEVVDVAGLSARVVARARWRLPAGGGWRLAARLYYQDALVTDNNYDLEAHDGLVPTPRQRLWAWLTGWVIPS